MSQVGIADYLGETSGRSVGLVVSALEAIGHDTAGLDRLALASSFAQGESQWVWETILRLVQAGVPHAAVEREIPVKAMLGSRIDLRVYETAVEFKSAFTHFFLNNREQASIDWFSKDWEKLRATNGHGVFVLTLATAAGFTHRHRAITRGTSNDWRSDRTRGLAAYTDFLTRRCGGPVTHVEVGCAVVPASQDRVMLDALVAPID